MQRWRIEFLGQLGQSTTNWRPHINRNVLPHINRNVLSHNARGLESEIKLWQGQALAEALRQDPAPPFLAPAGYPWCPLACGHMAPNPVPAVMWLPPSLSSLFL